MLYHPVAPDWILRISGCVYPLRQCFLNKTVLFMSITKFEFLLLLNVQLENILFRMCYLNCLCNTVFPIFKCSDSHCTVYFWSLLKTIGMKSAEYTVLKTHFFAFNSAKRGEGRTGWFCRELSSSKRYPVITIKSIWGNN